MNKDVVVAIAAVLAVVLICFGVASMRGSYPAIESHPFVASAGHSGSPSAAAAATGPIVMHVNGEPVTQKEFEMYVAAAPEQMRTFASSAEGRRLIADQLVTMKVLEQEGQKLGADRDPETATQLALMRANAAAGFALQKLVGEPTEPELRATYEKEKSTAAAPQVRHILISCGESQIPSRTGAAVPCDQAEKKAQQLGAAIHSRDEFERAARAVSDDTNSGAEGGLLGPLRPGSMPPDVEHAVTSLQPDQVSRPIRTPYGWHLFAVSAPEPEPFEKLRPGLVQKWKQEKLKAVMTSAKQGAKVELDPKYFGSAEAPPAAPPPAKRAS